MFAKLLKHEWRSTWGTLGIMSIIALSLGVVGGVLLRILVTRGDEIMQSNSPLVLLPVVMIFSLFFLLLGIVVYVAGVEYWLIYRFYKSRFTDEGYLTFTLPVNSHQIFLSAFLNIILCSLLAGVVAIGSIALGVFLGTVGTDTFNQEIMNELRFVFSSYGELYESLSGGSELPVWLFVAQFAVSLLYTPILLMTCVTVGSVLAKKHKLLAAIGCYYVASFAVSTLNSLLTSIVYAGILNDPASYAQAELLSTYWVQLGVQLVIGVGCYFLSTWLMNRKLNLP